MIVNVFKKFEELDEKMNEVSKKIKDIEMFLKVHLRAHELNFHYDVDSENTLIFKDRIYYMGEGYAHPTPLIECKFHVRNKMVNHLELFAEALYVFITGNND